MLFSIVLHRPLGNSQIYFRIRELARNMRKHATPAEDLFWEKVRNRKFHDLKINRQFILTALVEGVCKFYIADFYCHELKLIIELDGWIHLKQLDEDMVRTERLEDQGYTVVRFTNDEILNHWEEVCKVLLNRIEELWRKSLD